ncbi:MAG: hypothetical protein NVV83_02525 [Afipia sp.]|nr:hypothetical protein [Afipia sp.]
MAKLPPKEVYQQLCIRLRHRIEFAEAVLISSAPKWQIVEAVSLQGRKAIETIAHMCLVATEHSLGELGIPKDVKKHWNAETIFERLHKKNISVLPSPSRMKKSSDPRYKAVFEGVPENRLTYRELIALYQMCHEGLHDVNPYRLPESISYYEGLTPKLSQGIIRIKNFTWVHFIGIKGEGFAVDLRNTNGLTVVLPLSKIAELPID